MHESGLVGRGLRNTRHVVRARRPFVAKLMMTAAKFDKLEGPQKKKLVVTILNHLIGEIDGDAEHDSEFEIVLKSMVPAMVDGFASMVKAKQAIGNLFTCCMKA